MSDREGGLSTAKLRVPLVLVLVALSAHVMFHRCTPLVMPVSTMPVLLLAIAKKFRLVEDTIESMVRLHTRLVSRLSYTEKLKATSPLANVAPWSGLVRIMLGFFVSTVKFE